LRTIRGSQPHDKEMGSEEEKVRTEAKGTKGGGIQIGKGKEGQGAVLQLVLTKKSRLSDRMKGLVLMGKQEKRDHGGGWRSNKERTSLGGRMAKYKV